MKLTEQEKKNFNDVFCLTNDAHAALLKKVTLTLQKELTSLKQHQKNAVNTGIYAFVTAILDKFLWLPVPGNLICYGFGVYSGTEVKALLDKRPSYYVALQDATQAFDWLLETRLDLTDANIQNFLLAVLPLVNNDRLSRLEELIDENRMSPIAQKQSSLLSLDTAKYAASSIKSFFYAENIAEMDKALPLKFFINQMRSGVNDAKKLNLERYLYGEGHEDINLSSVLFSGAVYAKNQIGAIQEFAFNNRKLA